MVMQGQVPIFQSPSQYFVQRIMSPNIFSQTEEGSLFIKEG